MLGLGGSIIGGLGVALLAAIGGLAWQSGQIADRDQIIGRVTTEREQAVAIAAANAAAVEEAARLARHAEAATLALMQQRQARQVKTQTIIREVYRDRIQTAPGCPTLSPVLDDALGRLRGLRAGAPDPANPGPARPDTRAVAALR